MDDLMTKLQNILSSPEGQEQLKNISAMLNQGNAGSPPPAEPPSSSAASPTGGGLDLSGLAAMLGGNAGNPASPPEQASQGPDLSALAGMLSGLSGNLGGGTQTAESTGPNIDMGMILKLQQIFSKMNVNDKNSQLLLALKPHFGARRQAKVDQAISLMRLFSMLPALRESGIFAGL